MLRSIGVKYLVVHRKAYEDPALRDELLGVIDRDPQVVAYRTFEETTIAVLAPFEAPTVAGMVRRGPSTFIVARASNSTDRLPFLFDEDRDSRWLSARPQSGDEWLTLELDRPRDTRLVRLQLGARSFGDYPRDLAVDAVDGMNAHPLFRGSVLAQMARGVIADGGTILSLTSCCPRTRRRHCGSHNAEMRHTFYWSIHELQLFEHR
jgi:hypothetical protein